MATLTAILAANSDTYITVGKVATDLGITLKFVARRGSLNCMGTIKVSCPFTDYVDPAPLLDFDPPDGVGITAVVADISGADIRIKITVDDASVTDVTFDYNLSVVKGIKGVYFNANFTGIPTYYSGNTIGYNSLVRQPVRVNEVYHLFTEAKTDSPLLWWISKRLSPDGIDFRAETSPLLLPGDAGTYDEKGQADPAVIYDGVGDWKMWFDALNGALVWDKLGYATSTDGDTWTKYGSILNRGSAGAWDDGFMHHPAVVKHNGIYYMFYAGAHASNQPYQIGLATSSNGIDWTKEPSNPVISQGASGEWDDAYVRPSCPVLINGIWYMYYWAMDGATFAIGLATSTDLIHWTKKGRVLEHGASANGVLLEEGTNVNDKIIQIWTNVASAPFGLTFAKATLTNSKTQIDVFEEDKVKDGDSIPVVGGGNTYAANYIYGGRVTVANNCTTSKFKVFFTYPLSNISGKVKGALYANGANTPTTLLGITEERDWKYLEGGKWTEFVFNTPVALAPGEYWISIWSTVAYQRSRVAGGSSNWFNTSLAYGDFPNPITAGSLGSFSGFDMYLIEDNTLNVYNVALASEPNHVYFNTIIGNKQTLKADVNSEFDWFWSSGILYIYSVENPNIRYNITYD